LRRGSVASNTSLRAGRESLKPDSGGAPSP
jgi:hypothetical protein